jgi:hypothetical protein
MHEGVSRRLSFDEMKYFSDSWIVYVTTLFLIIHVIFLSIQSCDYVHIGINPGRPDVPN